jgi:ribosomal protein S18 acetylase RimI-like enzyme
MGENRVKLESAFSQQGKWGFVMATVTDYITTKPSTGPVRPFDVRRDLSRVADLVELCFNDRLDRDGQRYLQQMRSAARNQSYLQWAGLLAERTSMPLSGYVWEENGQLIGNLTLIPYYSIGRRYYLIANVAVHPDFRRRGIASTLTSEAINHAQQRGAQSVWLHARQENAGAVQLYQAAGFAERARRTTWLCENRPQADLLFRSKEENQSRGKNKVTVGARRSSDWNTQLRWFERLYPPELTWHLSLNPNTLRPGLRGFLYRLFNDIQIQQWSAYVEKKLIGVLTWQASKAYADYIWIATREDNEDLAVESLLTHARKHLNSLRPISLDYPAGRASDAISAAGFKPHQTLIWMALDL